jgi:hypothetical protein
MGSRLDGIEYYPPIRSLILPSLSLSVCDTAIGAALVVLVADCGMAQKGSQNKGADWGMAHQGTRDTWEQRGYSGQVPSLLTEGVDIYHSPIPCARNGGRTYFILFYRSKGGT